MDVLSSTEHNYLCQEGHVFSIGLSVILRKITQKTVEEFL